MFTRSLNSACKTGKGSGVRPHEAEKYQERGVVEKTFRPTEKCPQARIDRSDKQYLYNDGDLYYFMDTETYDQVALSAEDIGDALKFVQRERDGEDVRAQRQHFCCGAASVCGACHYRD